MVIGIDARELAIRPAGKGQYLGRLIRSWMPAAAAGDYSLVLYISGGTSLPAEYEGAGVGIVAPGGRGPLWHRNVSMRLEADGVSVFFAALSYLSALVNLVPTVTVVHDLAVFRLPQMQHGRLKSQVVERLTLRACCRRSKRILTISNHTKKDVIEVAHVRPGKVEVVYPAAMLTGDQEMPPLGRDRRKPYLLFVGTLEPRKNIPGILQAYALLPKELRTAHPLKLAGKAGWGGDDYQQMARDLGLESQVEFLGYVSDAELLSLYRDAVALVYPSLYEGFGLPPLEAMSVGTPVVTSAVSSLPEVVGSGGVLCDPTDTAALSGAMRRLIEDPAFWEEKSRQGLRQAQSFSWPRAAEAVLAALRAAQRVRS